jgi:hypothetical protein
MQINLSKFKYTLPYANELFGLYQPLLGWRSIRTKSRLMAGVRDADNRLLELVSKTIYPNTDYYFADGVVRELKTGTLTPPSPIDASPVDQSLIVDRIYDKIKHLNIQDVAKWGELLRRDNLDSMLLDEMRDLNAKFRNIGDIAERSKLLKALVDKESIVAGLLNYLYERKLYAKIADLFAHQQPDIAALYQDKKKFFDPLETFDPKTDLGKVGLSPVGIVHLFRQYFFEFDTFLGTPVQHIWLSPGGTVELVEVSTRKTTLERLSESFTEMTLKSEKSITEQDEISDAVKQDNENNTKFGASATVNERWGWGDANQTANMEFRTTQKEAREQTHKHMRQQSEKLSSEIKKNFKSTFKTVTEVQDTTSKRYVLQNTTDKLVNYELRRKMRQVGVQVQDLGTQLCWQSYVEDPGQALGIAKLVHFAAPPDFSSMGPIDELPPPDEYTEPVISTFPLPVGEATYDGWYQWVGYVQLHPKGGYIYKSHGTLQFTSGGSVSLDIQENKVIPRPGHPQPSQPPPPQPYLSLFLTGGHSEHGGDQMQISIPVTFSPSPDTIKNVADRNVELLKKRTAESDRLTRESYIKAARERIKAASNIQPRRYDELREEERTVVYRKLIISLLNVGVDLVSDFRVLHKVSELINSMFDIDKMLYFVAPEWWRPRIHRNSQTLTPEIPLPPLPVLIPGQSDQLGERGITDFTSKRKPVGLDEHVVGWGGLQETGRDNYYITEDSVPARLGSSLGWLLQLDGDNMRNAFLNAPWVKAVIPIRPGKEIAALNWLSHTSVEGNEGLDDFYTASSVPEREIILEILKEYSWDDAAMVERYKKLTSTELTVRDALRYVAVKVKQKHEVGQEKVAEELDTGVTLNYLPPDQVFEHGFDPLDKGIRLDFEKSYEVFDQWIEILPTDQVVAVEVKYDPKTGRQI